MFQIFSVGLDQDYRQTNLFFYNFFVKLFTQLIVCQRSYLIFAQKFSCNCFNFFQMLLHNVNKLLFDHILSNEQKTSTFTNTCPSIYLFLCLLYEISYFSPFSLLSFFNFKYNFINKTVLMKSSFI